MADSLAIITGIFAIVFLLFFLAFNLSKDQGVLKLILVSSGLFFIAFIPGQLHEESPDCGILANGTYICYNITGGKIDDFGEGNTIGADTFRAYTTFLSILSVWLIYFAGKWAYEKIPFIQKTMNSWRKKYR